MLVTRNRIVDFHLPTAEEGTIQCAEGVAAAMVVWANGEGDLVNLTVFDELGGTHGRIGVPFIAGHRQRPEGGGFACFPPHTSHEPEKKPEPVI